MDAATADENTGSSLPLEETTLLPSLQSELESISKMIAIAGTAGVDALAQVMKQYDAMEKELAARQTILSGIKALTPNQNATKTRLPPPGIHPSLEFVEENMVGRP